MKVPFLGDGSRWYPCFGLLVTSSQGFKSQGGFLICMLHCLHAVASSYSTVVIDLLTSWWPTLQPSLFLSTYFFKHWWDSGSSVQHSVHSNHLSHSRSTSHIKYLVFITFTKRGNRHVNASGHYLLQLNEGIKAFYHITIFTVILYHRWYSYQTTNLLPWLLKQKLSIVPEHIEFLMQILVDKLTGYYFLYWQSILPITKTTSELKQL